MEKGRGLGDEGKANLSLLVDSKSSLVRKKKKKKKLREMGKPDAGDDVQREVKES